MCQSDIPFGSSALKLGGGVVFHSQLALKKQVNKLLTGLSGDQTDHFNLTVSFF